MKARGVFYNWEGGDCCGKETQAQFGYARLLREGRPARLYSFPRYATAAGRTTRQMLRSTKFDPTTLDPHAASLFFSGDRLDAKPEMEFDLADGTSIVSDRYQPSNKGIQGAKFATREERVAFYQWLDELEYVENGIPKPDVIFYLHLPPEVALRRALASGKVLDGHETLAFQQKAEQIYLELVELYPQDYVKIECVRPDGYELTREEIHELVWAEMMATERRVRAGALATA